MEAAAVHEVALYLALITGSRGIIQAEQKRPDLGQPVQNLYGWCSTFLADFPRCSR